MTGKSSNGISVLHVICSCCFTFRIETKSDQGILQNPFAFQFEVEITYIWISCDLLTFLSVLTKLSPNRIKNENPTFFISPAFGTFCAIYYSSFHPSCHSVAKDALQLKTYFCFCNPTSGSNNTLSTNVNHRFVRDQAREN